MASSSSSSSEGAASSSGGGAERYDRRAAAAVDDAEFVATSSALHRWAAHAGALTSELRRVAFVLCEQPSLSGPAAAAGRRGVIRSFGALWASLPSGSSRGGSATSAVAPYVDDDDAFFALYALPMGRRLSVVPRRHIGHAAWTSAWNAPIAARNAAAAVACFPCRGWQRRGAAGALTGVATGCGVGAAFLLLGFVALPALHAVAGLRNSAWGVANAFTSALTFDGCAGRYEWSDVAQSATLRAALVKESQRIVALGCQEQQVRKAAMERKHKEQFGKSIGERMKEAMAAVDAKKQRQQEQQAGSPNVGIGSSADAAEDDYYEVLQVKRSASTAEIKASYQRLARTTHPDRNPNDPRAATKFHALSRAYKVLTDPKTRRAYDIGGASATRHAMDPNSVLGGTPQDVVQKMFGGAPFEAQVSGPWWRSPWHLRMHHLCTLSTTEFEALQVLRARLLSAELATILDVHARARPLAARVPGPSPASPGRASQNASASPAAAPLPTSSPSKPAASNTSGQTGATAALITISEDEAAAEFSPDFRRRIDVFVRRLGRCSFGPELLHEVGLSYTVGARRFLGESPFWYPKALYVAKMLAGFQSMTGMVNASLAKDLQKQHLISVFDMEFDNVRTDLHLVCRFSVMMMAGDRGVLQGSTAQHEQQPGKATSGAQPAADVADGAEVRRRRLRALLYLGEQMLRHGRAWGPRNSDSYMEQLQKVAPTPLNNNLPPPF